MSIRDVRNDHPRNEMQLHVSTAYAAKTYGVESRSAGATPPYHMALRKTYDGAPGHEAKVRREGAEKREAPGEAGTGRGGRGGDILVSDMPSEAKFKAGMKNKFEITRALSLSTVSLEVMKVPGPTSVGPGVLRRLEV